MLCRPLSLVNTRRKFQQVCSNALHSAYSKASTSEDASTPKRRGRPPKRFEDASFQDLEPTRTSEISVIIEESLQEESRLELVARDRTPSTPVPEDVYISSSNHPLRKTRERKRFSDLPTALNRQGGRAAPLDPDWRQTTKKQTTLGTEHIPRSYSSTLLTANPVPTLIPSIVNNSPTVPTGSSLPSTQLALDIIENLAKFPHCILLTRVGNFYEVSTRLSQRMYGPD